MTDEATLDTVTPDTSPVTVEADQAVAAQQASEPASPAPAEPTVTRKEAENEWHQWVAQGLAAFGKAEHWLAEEIKAYAMWLMAKK